MTPEGKIKKEFMRKCVARNIVPFISILKHLKPCGVIVSLELFRMRGIPDKMVLLSGTCLCEFVEFKREGGGIVSPEQRAVFEKLRALGFPVHLVDSTESIEALLDHWDALQSS